MDDQGIEVFLRYMKRTGEVYEWPTVADYSLESANDVLCVMEPPTLINNRRQFKFNSKNLATAKQICMQQEVIRTVIFK